MNEILIKSPWIAVLFFLLLLNNVQSTLAFVVIVPPKAQTLLTTATHPAQVPRFSHPTERNNNRINPSSWQLWSSSSLPDIESMKASDMRKELESYGISTKSFLEKKDFSQALEKARSDGMKTQQEEKKESTSSSSSSTSTNNESGNNKSRDERLKEEMEKVKDMKVGDLRKELQSFGISTKSFFEKSEFVRALAEARVDGVKNNKGSSGRRGGGTVEDEPYDASYRDVVMQKFKADPRLLRGQLIDIQLGR